MASSVCRGADSIIGVFAVLLGFGLIAAFSGMMTGSDDSQDDKNAESDDRDTDTEGQDIAQDIDPLEPDTPDEQPDLGYSVSENDDGTISVELGDDETGRLALMNVIQQPDNGLYQAVGSRLYFVPPDAEFPTSETFTLAELEAESGLEILADWNLAAFGTLPSDSSVISVPTELPDIVTDEFVHVFEATANVDGATLEFQSRLVDEFANVAMVASGDLPEPDQPRYVLVDTTGTDLDEAITARAASITVSGEAGNDTLVAENDDVLLLGGSGDDDLSSARYLAGLIRGSQSWVTDVELRGGDGNDSINILTGTAYGDAGNDTLVAEFDLDATLYGGGGDDLIRAGWALNTAIGEGGDDSLWLLRGATGLGGADNDTLRIIDGSMGYGNSGDDELIVSGGSFGSGGADDDTLINTQLSENDTLRGDAGNDTLSINGTGSVAMGGEGEDSLSVSRGASGFGGDGDDYLSLGSGGGFADGGTGNDTLTAGTLSSPDTTILTGGEGNDTFTMSTPRAFVEPSSGGVTITDFDPTQDVIEISGFDAEEILNVTIVPGDADTATRVAVDVLLEGANETFSGTVTRTETYTFLLEGGPAVTASNIILAA